MGGSAGGRRAPALVSLSIERGDRGLWGETARLAGSGMAARHGRGGQKRPQIALDRVTGHARRR